MKLPILLIALAVSISGNLFAQEKENRITIAPAEREKVLERMTSMVVPRVDFVDTKLGEAVDFFRRSENDCERLQTAPKPYGFIIVTPGLDERKIKKLSVRDIAFHDLLNQCAALTGSCIYVSNNLIEFHDGDRIDPARFVMPEGKAMDAARNIIIPRLDFVDTSLEEAAEFLNSRSADLVAPEERVQLVIDPSADSQTLIPQMRARDISLADAAMLMALRTGNRFASDATTLRIVKPK
ncbi:MAG: hypothetical protein EOP87_14360 [Verrucomicrobiaceae bacterium]|nr:MAG: hypothetical protein EOP87_14360 [Verrucomicrobiaceae bacterium]